MKWAQTLLQHAFELSQGLWSFCLAQGSDLWKLQAWGSKTPTDSGPQISAADQVLSSFQSDSTLDPSSDFGFQVTYCKIISANHYHIIVKKPDL